MKRIISLALALLAFTCGDNVIINGEIPPVEQTSPANVLKNVEISFNERDIDMLKRVLSPTFVFYTDPGEIGRAKPDGNSPRPPPCYNYTEFWNIAYILFNEAYDISLSISTGRVGEPAPEENIYSAGNVDLVLLVMADEVNGYVADGYCNFEFESYPTKERKKNWRITNLSLIHI